MSATPAALAPLADDRTAQILARLDAVVLRGYTTGPGLDSAERQVAALLLADHHTDNGTRRTATGSTRDEVFWRRYTGPTYDLMNAYGAARLRTGAIQRPPHRCTWGCGTPCPAA
ncbi:hypothetical protein ACIQTN_29630 [Streptomyces werraensis]|uniref:hypothetical protein n=1 Tax=Streptomyces werraensis TaxID=68284 RepID=UPI00380BC558